eukprot:m51a1_g4150 hypothetical protein (164) ;mRNA; f:246403-246894
MCEALERFLKENIELTVPLGVRVDAADSGHVVVRAPLSGNRNDKGCVFAGSSASVAVVTGWCMASRIVSDAVAHAHREGADVAVVAKETTVRYRAPLRSDFVSVCVAPAGAAADAAHNLFDDDAPRRGRAAVELDVELRPEGAAPSDPPAVTMHGTYVALLKH